VARKTRQEKELSRLRRQLEALKAQRREFSPAPPPIVTPPAGKTAEPKTKPLPKNLEKAGIQRVDPQFIKKDLSKTGGLSLFALLIILILYLLRSRLPFI